MKRVPLRGAGLDVSRLCFGTMTFGGQTDESAAARIVDRCLDSGINFFDTANVYNRGVSEEIVGRLLRGRRSSVILASKVRGRMGDGPGESGLSRAAMTRAIDDSLRRLNTDYLDLYYLHQPDYDVPLHETLETMDRLVRQGKVRFPATSNYASWQVAQMLWICQRNGWAPPVLSQPMYNLLARGIEQEYLPMSAELGISTFVYNPLAGGLLTGKQTREAPIEGTRFDKNQMYLDRYWHAAYFDAVEELRGVSARAGRSMVSLSLNWLLHHTRADGVILGASRIEHLEANLTACEEGPLDEATLAACEAVWAKLRGVTPKYNR